MCASYVCVWLPPIGGFHVPGLRPSASYFPYLYVGMALAVVNYADESCLSQLCECLHQDLEEGRVVGPRGGVCVGAVDFSSGPASLDLESCGG